MTSAADRYHPSRTATSRMSAAAATSRPRAPHRGGRRRFDHDAAFARYALLGVAERTYAGLAAEFGVSDVTIRKVAKRDDWAKRVEALDREASRKAEKRVLRTLEERKLRTLMLVEGVRDLCLERLQEIDPSVALRVFTRLATLELLIEGEATSRVDVGEVQALVKVFTEAVDELETLAGDGRAEAALRVGARLDSELARLAALTAGGRP